ncbi:A-kinase anchor protein 13 isoform X2 [Otolemur garnettii]|uniref:A-kinase anchor protein 13 isoform X2 n=1 Tax=Otolemur garnettii TaxID=30611 RepID=UPI000C7F49F3|nr:A-kinase anchor protein 13 isoform X2 [Otolemur garnettii]
MGLRYSWCLGSPVENAGEPESWSSLSYEIPYGDCSVRHHRELDIYTLTSESESRHEPPFPGDSCTGHIFKLMNIQQQLMKTNLKQTDTLTPLMMTAQDSFSPHRAPETDGQSLLCASEPTGTQQLSSEQTKSAPCCRGSPGGQIDGPCDLPNMTDDENAGFSLRRKNKDAEREAEGVEPAPTGDSRAVSNRSNCLQSLPDWGTEGLEGNRNEETGTESSRMATYQKSLSSGDSVLQGDMVMEPGTAQCSLGGKLASNSSTDASTPETAGETEHGLVNPEAGVQKNVPQVGGSTKERSENTNVSTAGASGAQGTNKPMDEAIVSDCVSAAGSLCGNKPAESLLTFNNRETAIEKTAETETSRICEESAGAPVDQSTLVIPATAKDKSLEGSEPRTPSAICQAVSPSALTFPELGKDVIPGQKPETNSSHAQSQKSESPVCSTTGDGKLCVDSACQQNRATSSGEVVAKQCSDIASQPESTTTGQASTLALPTAVCCEDSQANTATSDPVRDAQEGVDFCSLKVLNKEGQGKDLKRDKPFTNTIEGVSHPHPVVPKTERELAPDQALISDGTFSLANTPGSESVTKDDVISFVPSQKEKGTATPKLHTATDCRNGSDGDSHGPREQPVEDKATGPAASEPEPSMGNTSPTGCAGEHEGPGLSATSDVLNVEEGTDSCPLSVGKDTLASGMVLTEEGKNLVAPESLAAQGKRDRDELVTYPSSKEDTISSGTVQEQLRPPPPGQETPGFLEKPNSAACARDSALHSQSLDTPSACLKAETKPDKEVAPRVSLLTEGGAAQSLVPPGASLAVDSRQEALGAEQSSSLLLPNGSETLHCLRPCALDVGVKSTECQGAATCEVRGNVMVDAVVSQRGTEGPKGKDVSHSAQEKSMILGLPGALPDKGETDLQQAASPEIAPLNWEKGKLEGADDSCAKGDSKEAQMDGKAHPVLLQPVARELPTDTGLSTRDNEAAAGVSEVTRTVSPGKGGRPPSPPCAVSAQAAHLSEGEDLIEVAASHIVDAVIERVKALGVPLPVGEIRHPSLSSPKSGPLTKQLENAPTEEVSAFLPEETLPVGSICEESSQNFAGCFAGRKEPEKIILPIQGPEQATDMPDTRADDEVDFLSNTIASSVSEEAAAGSVAVTLSVKHSLKTQAINQENWCTIEPCPDAGSLLTSKPSPECENFLGVGVDRECASTQGARKLESGSDSDLFPSPGDERDSIVFPKPEDEQLACDITGSSSSTDDTASLDRHSSHGSDVSLPQISKSNWSKDQQSLDGFCSHGGGADGRESESEPAGPGDVEEEEMDSITEVPAHCSVLRGSMRSLSPFRRHSWGPGKNAASDAEMNQRSSMRILGDVVRRPPIHRRSMSWCPSGVQYSAVLSADFNYRSFSLEGLIGGAGVENKPSSSLEGNSANSQELRYPFSGEERGDSLVSLSEEDLESGQREHRRFDQTCHRSKQQGFNYCTSAISSPLTKSISLMAISHPGLDNSRPFHTTSANLTESITEENFNFLPQSPSKKDFEGKSGTKVSRTFSYIRNKMSSSKKSKEKEKEKEKTKEKEKDSKEKEKDKKTLNGHTFSSIPVVGPISCGQCMKPFTSKDAYTCANCGAFVHKGCRESLASCAKIRMKQPKGSLQAHDTSSLPTVIMRNKPSQPKERPRSAVLLADETTTTPMFANRRSQQSVSLSKSVSIQNITGVGSDENMSNTWKFLSHSTDSLNKISKVNESTESLTDEVGTDMNEGQLMGDFEIDSKQLEAESWSRIVDSKFLKQQKKDVVKRQEVIYELMQTEFHHLRTLKIMSDVYSRGMMTDLLFEQQMVEKLFPCLDELISIHSQFFQRILERKKESLVDKNEKNFLIKRIGDVLVNQFSGENAERLKKTYGKFCGQHNQSVNYFKDLYTKDKRFQAFVKKKMSSSVVRRLGIPECILLVTQRITKYPVLFQRILQCTKDNEAEQDDLAQSLSLVKDVIGAVDSKVASYEKKVRLNEIYMKTDSKSIMRMKSGQMFAKEDLKRKKLVRDGSVFLKSATGRLKEVQAVLLTDILVFLQEKDQKYIFASLDQKSTVISLKKLIVREVAHEEKGLFLISMGMRDPEMVEVHASSKEERNSWIQIIQDTINTLNRDEDEGIPSENEEEKKMLDTKARELKEQLQQKDHQILLLLEEKEMIFRDMAECSTPLPEDYSPTQSPRILFRSNTEEALKGGPLMKSAINEVEILQSLVSGSLGGTLGQAISNPIELENMVGPISLPRRAETFGGFDSHQMNASKGGEKEEGDDGQDLRRTESDSGLKKGGNANPMFMLKRNNEQLVQSIVHLHELLSTLQGVVLQQDSHIEDQKLLLSERALTRSLSRPSSLIEQEKQRSLEKQRQDLANLQRQQAQLLEDRRRREREWEARERDLQEREARLAQREEKVQRGQQDLERDWEELQQRKGAYQCDLERLRASQRQLERDREQLRRDVAERLSQTQVSHQHTKLMRIPSFCPSPEASPLPSAPSVAKSGSLDSELSASPRRNSISRTHKEKVPFHILSSTGQPDRAPGGQSQAPVPTSAPARLFGLAKPKEKKDKKKKSKASRSQPGDGPAEVSAEGEEIFC